MRFIHKLSVTKVKTIKKEGCHGDGGGLYLRVKSGGTKSWTFRYMLAGRRRDAGLGSYPAVGLAKARELAEESRRLLAGGIDPIERRATERAAERAAAAKAMTFQECAKAYVGAHEAGWRNAKHRQQWRNTLATYVYPALGAKSVQDIDTETVLTVLDPIWLTKPETASRVRGRIEVILDWAKVKGYRDGENPARWRGHLQIMLSPKTKVRRVKHHAALPYNEVGTFMAELREQTSIGAKALEFTILTAARTGEALGATWDEIDLVAKMWTIPAHRMKGGCAHRVPLSIRATAILKKMTEIRQGEYVFPGMKEGRPLSDMTLTMLLRRMGHDQITVHGFRSTFRDWAAECANTPNHIAEMALAHTIGDRVEASYRRGDLLEKRKRLMDDWATFCARQPTAKVVPLRRRG
jgi:integrase